MQIFTQKKRKILHFAPNWSVFVNLLHYHMVNLAGVVSLEQEQIIALGRRGNDVRFVIGLRAMTTAEHVIPMRYTATLDMQRRIRVNERRQRHLSLRHRRRDEIAGIELRTILAGQERLIRLAKAQRITVTFDIISEGIGAYNRLIVDIPLNRIKLVSAVKVRITYRKDVIPTLGDNIRGVLDIEGERHGDIELRLCILKDDDTLIDIRLQIRIEDDIQDIGPLLHHCIDYSGSRNSGIIEDIGIAEASATKNIIDQLERIFVFTKLVTGLHLDVERLVDLEVEHPGLSAVIRIRHGIDHGLGIRAISLAVISEREVLRQEHRIFEDTLGLKQLEEDDTIAGSDRTIEVDRINDTIGTINGIRTLCPFEALSLAIGGLHRADQDGDDNGWSNRRYRKRYGALRRNRLP